MFIMEISCSTLLYLSIFVLFLFFFPKEFLNVCVIKIKQESFLLILTEADMNFNEIVNFVITLNILNPPSPLLYLYHSHTICYDAMQPSSILRRERGEITINSFLRWACFGISCNICGQVFLLNSWLDFSLSKLLFC